MQSLFSNTLNPSDYRTLCRELYTANLEDDVVKILDHYGLWNNDLCWTDYGNDENNVATIGNQTNNAEAALVEKFTNSIDAVLMKEARLRGIDPKSADAPQSINEAMEQFYGVSNQNLKTAKADIFEKLKHEIYLVATGSFKKPSLAIIDKGEGQTPNMLPHTILSLKKTNKLEIHFVQGQFNQGGTAVLPYCGEKRLELIISKRNPDIASPNDDSHNKWGFTIVRRNTSEKHSRNTRYEYLTIDGNVLSFEQDSLPLLPSTYPHAHHHELKSGTYIKLYEYNINIASHINTTLRYHLSMLLPGAKIPINFAERRAWYPDQSQVKGSMGAILYGHFHRFKNDPSVLEKGFPFNFSIDVDGQKLDVLVACLKVDKKRSYKDHEGILFTLNGQTQGVIHDRFFDHKAVGLGYLKDSLMVFVDATNLDTVYREDLFMSDRQRLRDIKFKRDIEKLIEEELSSNKLLHNLQVQRRKQAISDHVKKSDALKNTLTKLLKTSPSLNMLFNTGNDIKNPLAQASGEHEDLFSFIGNEYPNYFSLTKEHPNNDPKLCPINKSFRIVFKTDVENGYFLREHHRGLYEFQVTGHNIEKFSFGLHNGKATFTCFIPSNIDLKTSLEFSYKIFNENPKIEAYTGIFFVQVDESDLEISKSDPKKEPKKPHEQTLNLPTVHEVYKNEWDIHSFSETDAIKIIPNEGSYDFFINMDNQYLVLERKNLPTDELRTNELFKSSLFLYTFSLLESESYSNNIEQVSESAKYFSRVAIPMIHMGDIMKI
ncbi:MAG: hypothetical protein Q7T77_03795 [Sulfuricurvum sp.]|nr:hypothetical protein [Sulfuricurvum sp.]